MGNRQTKYAGFSESDLESKQPDIFRLLSRAKNHTLLSCEEAMEYKFKTLKENTYILHPNRIFVPDLVSNIKGRTSETLQNPNKTISDIFDEYPILKELNYDNIMIAGGIFSNL